MEKRFLTAISCMDGRIQLAVNEYMQNKFGRLYVDTITAAGPAKIISEKELDGIVENIKFRTDISVTGHKSNAIAVVGHFDCAGIPLPDAEQKEHIRASVKEVQSWYKDLTVIGLWVNADLSIEEL